MTFSHSKVFIVPSQMERIIDRFSRLQYYAEDVPCPESPAVMPRVVPVIAAPSQFDAAQIANPVTESCATKVVMSAFMGYLMGNALGLVFGSYESIAPPVPLPGERELPKTPIPEQMKLAWRSTGEKCRYWGNNFMIVTAVFSGVECVVEKGRAKHDIVNGTLAGCATGAALAAGQGPQAMCLGCTGFAAFSAAIDHFMGH